MALAVFLLLCGILAAELAVIGFTAAGWAGAVSLLLCATVLATSKPPRSERPGRPRRLTQS